MLTPFLNLLYNILSLYELIVILSIVIHWLIYFGILNAYQPLVRKINEVLSRLTEPVYRQVRRVIPVFSGVDLSPIVVFLAIFFLQDVIMQISLRYG